MPEAPPKLLVMSRRTTPLSVSALGPLEPSPGKGPAVSSGIEEESEVVLVEVDAAVPPPPPSDELHAARAAAPDPSGEQPEGAPAAHEPRQIVAQPEIMLLHVFIAPSHRRSGSRIGPLAGDGLRRSWEIRENESMGGAWLEQATSTL